MNFRSKSSWEIFVFLVVTVCGLVLSAERIITPKQRVLAATHTPTPRFVSPQHVAIDIGCLNANRLVEPMASSGAQVRFQARLCRVPSGRGLPKIIKSLRVENLTNGAVATTFQTLKGSFLTDALMLQSGRNRVRIEWHNVQRRDSALRALEFDVFSD